MNKRIELLEKITSLDKELIYSNNVTKKEYNEILNEMKKHQIFLSSNENKSINIDNKVKFVSGAFFPFLIMTLVPFMNTFKGRTQKIGAFILMLVITVIFGFLSMLIPVLPIGWLNYGIPMFIEILFMFLLVSNSNKNK